MRSHPSSDQVLEGLGDKVVDGLAAIVAGAQDDLAEYRSMMPHAVSRASSRGLAGWIHDSMWARAQAIFDDNPEVELVESGPTRDIYITRFDTVFHLRLKRHTSTGAIRSYPTQTALEFIAQDGDIYALLGSPIVNLISGYEWDSIDQTILGPVLSLRDGSFEDVIWMIDLPTTNTGGGTVIDIAPTDPGEGPIAPVIELPKIDGAENEETGES